MSRRVLTLFSMVIILTVLVSACGQPQVEYVEVTKVVEGETVVETVEVEVEKEGPTTITIWSHFANEPNFRQVIQQVFDDYMAENPDVVIEVAWFDKEPLRDSIRTVMQSGGDGAPDITTFDHEDVQWAEAGWLEPFNSVLDFDRFIAGADLAGSYPDLGMPDTYKFNMAAMTDYILYNKELFDELGIEVPDDYQFTQDEFVDVIQTCEAAGYDGFANAIGNRPYPGQYLPKAALLSLVGPEEFNLLWTGQTSWDTPEVRQALEFVVEAVDAGAYPGSFSTMTLDEAHLYFHTQKKACMFFNGSWYTSRAFKPVDEGGQSPDFHFGFLKYPEMDGAEAPNAMVAGFPTGYAVLANSPHKEIALDIFKFWSEHPEYGAMWSAVTNMASAIKYTPEDVPAEFSENQWQWYWDEFNTVYGDSDFALHGIACGDFNDALVTVLNEGLNLGLFTVDEAIEYLDGKLCTE